MPRTRTLGPCHQGAGGPPRYDVLDVPGAEGRRALAESARRRPLRLRPDLRRLGLPCRVSGPRHRPSWSASGPLLLRGSGAE